MDYLMVLPTCLLANQQHNLLPHHKQVQKLSYPHRLVVENEEGGKAGKVVVEAIHPLQVAEKEDIDVEP